MPKLAQKQIDRYRELFKKQFKKEISENEATAQIQQLSRLFWVVYYKPLSKSEKQKLEKYINH